MCFDIYWTLYMFLFPVWSELTDKVIYACCLKTDPVSIGSTRSLWERCRSAAYNGIPLLFMTSH